MAKILIDTKAEAKLSLKEKEDTLALCPFAAIEVVNGNLVINDKCRLCMSCVRKGPAGVYLFEEDKVEELDKSQYQGITVYLDNHDDKIHPVSIELLGKARELADKISTPLYALLIGHNLSETLKQLDGYPIDKIFVYDDKKLAQARIETSTAIFSAFNQSVKPAVILVGATVWGRSLGPRVAAKLKTGLTADCTKLDIKENSDLVQIRPAFGGNIMAQIVTPNHRPQMATVRYKIFSPLTKTGHHPEVVYQDVPSDLVITTEILKSHVKEKAPSISDAEILVAVGRGFKAEKDLEMARELAELLGGQLACTRPLIEAGWLDASLQIGLSGRTVKPKLIVCLGISGSVQFKAGMENAELILAVNQDEHATIFDVAHQGFVGDLYQIVPAWIKALQERSS
ncbi:MAG: FAD-binding protein [Erysipelotrichaceae bacterium]|jgi:electron transfer flavoprotein alpha subunit|nr:FAD-binding protein [Erysipelotrichaceae bacterium]